MSPGRRRKDDSASSPQKGKRKEEKGKDSPKKGSGRSPKKGSGSGREVRVSPRRGKGKKRDEESGRKKGLGADTPASRASEGTTATVKRERFWKRYGPQGWPILWEEFKARRAEYFEDIYELVDIMEEEEAYDWDNCDDNGNPRRVTFIMPGRIRRGWKIFLLAYWDPLIEFIENLPSIWWIFRIFVRLLPTLLFLAALVRLGIAVWINWQYDEGDCVVEKLPGRYVNTGGMDDGVEGAYTVKRSFPPTEERIEGFVLQQCDVQVQCKELNFGETESKDDDRCVDFQTWEWGDKITCFYHNDDFYGTKQEKLYCLDRPSTLETEIFTVIIAGLVLALVLFLSGLFAYRRRQAELEDRQAREAMGNLEEETAEAKKTIEARELEEAQKQAERLQQGHPAAGEKDDDAV